jgi:hypothetical protein
MRKGRREEKQKQTQRVQMSKKRRSASRRRGRKRKRRRRRRAWPTMAAFGECLSKKRLHDGPSQVKAVEGKPHALFFFLVEKYYQVVIVPFGSRQSSEPPPYQCLNYMQGYLLRCTKINCSPSLPWNQVQFLFLEPLRQTSSAGQS